MADASRSLIVALDFPEPDAALNLAARLDPDQCRLKVGKELFVRGGPGVVEALMARGFEIFLDLKFHDIPNTVAAACRAAADLGVWMVNVHALGGGPMVAAAAEAVASGSAKQRPLLTAVTVLTSMDEAQLHGVGLSGSAEANVRRLARLAVDHGADGLVCSAREATVLRADLGEAPCLVTPGIRPAWAASDDQSRIMTPTDALAAGADHLVVGRPITAAEDPLAALHTVRAEFDAAG